MSLLKGLKNMVFEEENDGTETRVVTNPVSASPSRQAGQPPQFRAVAPPVSTVSVDPTFVDRIQKVAESAPQRSYTEFRGFFEAMELPDERSRYIASLAASNHKGFPADEVMRGIEVILKAIDDHKTQFQRSVPEQLEKTVGARRREIDSTNTQIAAKRQQIDQLNADIGRLTADQRLKETETVSEERKIKETEQKVIAAVEYVRAQYVAERERISAYSIGQPTRTS